MSSIPRELNRLIDTGTETSYVAGQFPVEDDERPGLQQLMADIRSGKVDRIVVYKNDRLTRSLGDFAKIVDVLDGAGASFVSVT